MNSSILQTQRKYNDSIHTMAYNSNTPSKIKTSCVEEMEMAIVTAVLLQQPLGGVTKKNEFSKPKATSSEALLENFAD